MATIQEYINQLKTDKQMLVDNLVAKGVEATNDETFTTLEPKVNDIQSGADLSEYFTETIESAKNFSNTIKKLPAFIFNGTSCKDMFSSGGALEEIDFSNFDTSNVAIFSRMFVGDKSLTSLNLSNFITDKATHMDQMFHTCSNLTELDLSNFNTSIVKIMDYMFTNCYLLETLNISSFDMSKVYAISNMFSGCTNLTNLTFGKNLGAGYLTTVSANYSSYKLDLSASTLLTEASLISVLNGLADIASKGVKTQSCVLGSTNLAKLTSEAGQQALAQAQAYGWTVS